MEEKRRDAGNLPANSIESPSSEPASSRRRAGAQKRKASSLSGSNSSSAPSKRVTRDKSVLLHPPNHNGPFTRARLGPNNVAGTASASAAGGLAAAAGSILPSEVQRGEGVAASAEELNKVSKLANLEASFEADFEAIKSRCANAHVVPNHCGWFSWSKVHPVEERTMPSFFSGKSSNRNLDMYMAIRNWIIKKFHDNPSTQIELKDLSELEVGELDARQEVFEFLDYWGLINFHPFLPTDSTAASDGDDEKEKKNSLVEKLFHFETLESCPSIITKSNATSAILSPGLLPESAMSEEMARPEGPSVEYHCNSCSADCSRKRFHCQKQADFDLCTECFNNGKFDSDMSSSDFILMEPAEVHGVCGGKWTDQETLLLLEALELYKENWNEIAEHVATKTKAQCILHFIQMPIEDTFFDSEDVVDVSAKETAVAPSSENDLSVPTEPVDNKATAKEDKPLTSNLETASKEDGEVKVGQDDSKPEDVEVKAGSDKSKPEVGGLAIAEDIALSALREAFEAIGYTITPESPLSFADVGNPVMALAAFLARLVGSDVASASARFSLKSISGKSPSLELAMRHCFILEDPPNDKEQTNSVSVLNVEADKNDNQECSKQNPDNSTPVLSDRALSSSDNNKKNGDAAREETTVTISTNGNSSNGTSEKDAIITHGVDGTSDLKESSESKLLKGEGADIIKESENSELKSTTNSVEKSGGQCVEKSSQTTVTSKDETMSDPEHVERSEIQKSVDDVPNPLPSLKNDPQPPSAADSVKEPPKNVAVMPDSCENNGPAQTEASNSMVDKEVSSVSSDSLSSAENATPQPIKSNSAIGSATGDNQSTDDKQDDSNCTGKKDDRIGRLKCAAVASLSAAAVKAKVLASQEEDQIRQLATILVEKQLHKLESKLAFFNEMDSVTMRVREQLDRSKQRLFQERAQIIAARLGLPASSARGMPPSLPANRMAMNFANSVPRPPLGMASQRPPISGPVGMAPTNNSNPLNKSLIPVSGTFPPTS